MRNIANAEKIDNACSEVGEGSLGAQQFGYVDTAIDGAFHRNHVLALEAFRVPHGAKDCYRSFLRFTDDLIIYMQAHPNKNGKPSVSGYPGPALAL